MESWIIYDSEPALDRPVVIEGLPGIGNVGKVAADFLASELKAERFATIYSPHLPPQVNLDGECVAELACNELYFVKDVNGTDVIFLLGEFQGTTPDGQYILAKELMDRVFLKFDVSAIYTLGGFGTGAMIESPRVLGAVSHEGLKNRLENCGVVFSPGEPGAGIVGASGLLLGMAGVYGIDAACLMGETSGYFVDHKSAAEIVKVLELLLGISVDKTELDELAQQLDELAAKVKETEDSNNKEALGYIG